MDAISQKIVSCFEVAYNQFGKAFFSFGTHKADITAKMFSFFLAAHSNACWILFKKQ